jgi:hydrogenase nickel incorporation protein HypB
MFAASRVMVLNKVDLLPHVDFDVARCIAHARRVNPAIEVLLVSARSGQGMDAWVDWVLEAAQAGARAPAAAEPAPTPAGRATESALRQLIAELEAQLAAARQEKT